MKTKLVIMSCVLLMVTGCGTSESGTVPGTELSGTRESSGAEESSGGGQGEAGSQEDSYITIAQVRTAVLENAGLSEEEVRFVRMHLDSENGVSEYDVEFVCQDAEYDYRVSALTGEILSMNCEMGNYDLDTLPPDVAQGGDNQPPDVAQGGDVQPPEVAQGGNNQPPAAVQAGNAPAAADGQYIGSEAAKRIALEHAGLTADEAHFVHAHLEQDDGSWKYDIEFHKDSTEYDYDIDALTGEILSFDRDAEYYQHGADASAGDGLITEDRAKQIALEYAGVAEGDAQRLKIELDYDHGRAEYEVEWHVGRTEYSCDVDAVTGEILSFEKELD